MRVEYLSHGNGEGRYGRSRNLMKTQRESSATQPFERNGGDRGQ